VTYSKESSRSHQAITEVAFPLHPAVRSEKVVSELVKHFLGDIRAQGDQASDEEVLQALAITTAIRLAVAQANGKPGIEMAIELLDVATDSLSNATIDVTPDTQRPRHSGNVTTALATQ
jgi:hypothetical protein